MSKRDRAFLHGTIDLFPLGDAIYIRVFSAYKPPHVMPTFIMGKVELQDMVYQITTKLSKNLVKD